MIQFEAAMKPMMEMGREFIKTFAASLDPRLWLTLLREEIEELEFEVDVQDKQKALKEYIDCLYVLMNLCVVLDNRSVSHLLPAEEQAEIKALFARLEKVSQGADKLLDVSEETIAEAYRRVHASNMSKLGDDGKPLRREDGKILKGPNYQPPVLDDLI